MLKQYRVMATIPAADMARARRFYEDTLGLGPGDEDSLGDVLYTCADGTILGLFLTYGHPGGDHTQVGWDVTDVEQVVQELRGKGVSFLDYDSGPLKTENGIATMEDGSRGAWFKDTEGNTLAVFQQG